MTDETNDPVTAAIAALTTRDVNQRRADALRTACHRLLEAQTSRPAPGAVVADESIVRVGAVAMGIAWCLAYVVEIIHRMATVYGF
jgi:hypothetical protein